MFRTLYYRIAKIGLGILSLTGSLSYAQQWQDVGVATISAGGSSFNNLAIDAQGNYYVSYYDLSVTKGSVQKFNGTSWSYVGGTAGITSGIATYNSLSLDALGNIYYTNQGTGFEVRKFSGASWSSLPSVSVSTTNYQASAVSSANVLFTYGSYGSGTVQRLVNGVWEQVGTAGISGGTPYSAEMVIGSNGKVYVCHNASGVKVYENNVTATATDAWTLMGGAAVGTAFTEGANATSDIAIGANNTLYVVYSSTTATNRRLNVKKFNGTAWEQVGNADFGISNDLYNVSIAVTPAGKLYVAASGWGVNSGKNTVYTFDTATNTWLTFGGDFVSDGAALYNDLQYDAVSNTLVLTYSQDGVKVKRIALQTTLPTCNNADPGTNAGDTGCVTFNYKGQTVTYTTVRGTDGKIWLQQNLGSSQVATSMADADSYGDLFQWGRWDDGHQTRTSSTTTVPSTNNPAGLSGITSFILGTGPSWWSTNATSDLWNGANTSAITSVVAIDPCKAIGTGWKLPSQADWVAAVNAESMASAATAFSSRLKLPAAGYRSQITGGFTYVGERGYYWSGDIANTGGKYLYNSTALANPNSGGPRAQGQSVRCIKDVTGLSTTDIRKATLGVYPNPTNGILNIKTDSNVENVNVTNAVGQKINVQFKNNQLNMNGLPNGVYIVELLLKDGQKISKKIIKN